jgi:acyl-coenzyme A thioesterase PaaI-like protein
MALGAAAAHRAESFRHCTRWLPCRDDRRDVFDRNRIGLEVEEWAMTAEFKINFLRALNAQPLNGDARVFRRTRFLAIERELRVLRRERRDASPSALGGSDRGGSQGADRAR